MKTILKHFATVIVISLLVGIAAYALAGSLYQATITKPTRAAYRIEYAGATIDNGEAIVKVLQTVAFRSNGSFMRSGQITMPAPISNPTTVELVDVTKKTRTVVDHAAKTRLTFPLFTGEFAKFTTFKAQMDVKDAIPLDMTLVSTEPGPTRFNLKTVMARVADRVDPGRYIIYELAPALDFAMINMRSFTNGQLSSELSALSVIPGEPPDDDFTQGQSYREVQTLAEQEEARAKALGKTFKPEQFTGVDRRIEETRRLNRK